MVAPTASYRRPVIEAVRGPAAECGSRHDSGVEGAHSPLDATVVSIVFKYSFKCTKKVSSATNDMAEMVPTQVGFSREPLRREPVDARAKRLAGSLTATTIACASRLCGGAGRAPARAAAFRRAVGRGTSGRRVALRTVDPRYLCELRTAQRSRLRG